MSMPVAEVGSYKRRTDTGAVCAGPCQLLGFYVSTTTAGTLVLTDGSTAMSGTITPAIGFHRFPATVGTSLTATIAGSALDVTFFYASGN
jgi:hypothetical protein